MATSVRIRRIPPAEAHDLLEPLAELLIDCVEGGASVGFMWPLPRERALGFWRGVADAVAAGRRVLLVAEDGQGLLGTVQLVLDLPDNQPHRADVVKMLVARRARRQGVALELLRQLEGEARAEHRHVLVLDAVTGGEAERLYERAGWQRVGSIPNYALLPDGRFCATTYMHRQLE
jgi:ribosomal protein S18 acetylase RimI-like enzyme